MTRDEDSIMDSCGLKSLLARCQMRWQHKKCYSDNHEMALYNKGVQFMIHYTNIKAYNHKNGRGGRNTPDLCTVVISIVLIIRNVQTAMPEVGFVFAYWCRLEKFGETLQAS